MDNRLLSGILLGGLICVSGSYGIVTLVEAYRASNIWGRLAVMGGVTVLLSAALADVAVTLVDG